MKLRAIVPLSLGLVAAVFMVYGQVRTHQFVSYDDPQYLTSNVNVQQGLTLRGITWAFSTFEVSNWHPVTWLSHMLDVELFGLNAGAHLMVNVTLHAINSVLVMLVLTGMTGAVWRSALVAALFVLHPLHVESVAWASERKDLLSVLFGLLAIWSYAGYARQPRAWRMALVACLMALSLMAKPMLVTLPCVLLLLDWWPLKRLLIVHAQSRIEQDRRHATNPKSEIRNPKWTWLLIEKTPLLVLSAASCVVTLLAQSRGGAVQTLERVPPQTRIANAVVSYGQYMLDMFWPANLAVIYPYPHAIPYWQVALSAGMLIIVSALAVMMARRRPHMVIGWLWFLGTLAPVIGLVQVGEQPRADRYTYFPLLGLFIALVWSIPATAFLKGAGRVWISALAAALLLALGALTWIQVRHWRDSVSLFQHAVDVTSKNAAAHFQLGSAWGDLGRKDLEYAEYEKALSIDPQHAIIHNNLGHDLLTQGRAQEAIAHFRQAIEGRPDFARAHFNLGVALAAIGDFEDAITSYREAARLRPDMAEAHDNMGIALLRLNRLEESIEAYRSALRIAPDSYISHFNLAWVYLSQKNDAQAAQHYQQALRINPNLPVARARLGDIFAAQGRIDESIVQYEHSLRLDGSSAETHNALGEVLVRIKRFSEAEAHFAEALRLRPDFDKARENLKQSQAGKGQDAARPDP